VQNDYSQKQEGYLESILEDYQDEVVDLEGELDNALQDEDTVRITQLKVDIKEAEDKCQRAKKNLQVAQDEINTQLDGIDKAKDDLEEARLELKEARIDLVKKAQDARKKFNQQKNKGSQKIKGNQAKKNTRKPVTSTGDEEDHRAEVELITDAHDKLYRKNMRLEMEIKDLTTELGAAKTANTRQATRLNTQLGILKQERDDLVKQIENLKKKNNDLIKNGVGNASAAAQKQIKDLMDERDQLSAQREMLKGELEERERLVDKMREKEELLAEKVEHLQRNLGDYDKKSGASKDDFLSLKRAHDRSKFSFPFHLNGFEKNYG